MQGHKVHKGGTKNTTKSCSNTRDSDSEPIDRDANRERSHDRALRSFGFFKERGYVIISKEVKPTDAETAVQAIAKRIQAMVLFVLNGLCFTVLTVFQFCKSIVEDSCAPANSHAEAPGNIFRMSVEPKSDRQFKVVGDDHTFIGARVKRIRCN